jgi:hypothetical protein|tara:strand:+ start:1147 stop:1809 length:663 start_codon:yes stop_codon:yes gene_type:complete
MALSKLNYNSLNLTPVAGKGIGFDSGADDLEASLSGGSMVFIKKLTADGSGTTLSFVHGSSDVVLDSTYKEYVFIFKDIHHSEADRNFSFNLSIDSGSNYNVAKTTTHFRTYSYESGGGDTLEYRTGSDLAQGTGVQSILRGIKGDNDASGAGYMHLFNPSSTTFVKHFTAVGTYMQDNTLSETFYTAGYGNTTSAVDAIQFSVNSGNIDAGTITLYGIN